MGSYCEFQPPRFAFAFPLFQGIDEFNRREKTHPEAMMHNGLYADDSGAVGFAGILMGVVLTLTVDNCLFTGLTVGTITYCTSTLIAGGAAS